VNGDGRWQRPRRNAHVCTYGTCQPFPVHHPAEASIPAAAPQERARLATMDMAWFGAGGLAITNGIARQAFYEGHVGDLQAHQVSTATLLAVFALTSGCASAAGRSRRPGPRWPSAQPGPCSR
jgi:hypothetical protein